MNPNNDAISILTRISTGLSGDETADVFFLNCQMALYRNHPDASIIQTGCKGILDGMGHGGQSTPANSPYDLSLDAVFAKTNEDIQNRQLESALNRLSFVIETCESFQETVQTDEVLFLHFPARFEYDLYMYHNKPQKQVVKTYFPYVFLYSSMGSLLFELNRIPEAREALLKGMQWDPYYFPLRAEYIETLKKTGDLEDYFNKTKDIMHIAYKPEDLARCYRNIGFVLIEKQDLKAAKACYLHSLRYDPSSQNAKHELGYIDHLMQNAPLEISAEDIREAAENYGFMLGADPQIISLAVSHGEAHRKNGETQDAKNYYTLAYKLTGDPEIEKILRELS